MKHIQRFPHLRFPLRAVPQLPLTLVKGVAQTLFVSRSRTMIKNGEITQRVETVQIHKEADESSTLSSQMATVQSDQRKQGGKRPVLRYIPRMLKTHRSIAKKRASQEQEIPQLSDLIDHNIETIISLHMHAELKVSRHQRILERLTAVLGRPSFFYVTLFVVAAWISLNLLDPYLHLPVFDPVPFSWLQGIIGLSALLMTILVLTTQNRQARFAERRKHLDLQVNLVVEHKVSKLIALVEELRRDMPIVKDRYDQEAAAMAEAVDPQAVFMALDETLAELDPDEEHMIIQSDFTMDMETSITAQDARFSSHLSSEEK